MDYFCNVDCCLDKTRLLGICDGLFSPFVDILQTKRLIKKTIWWLIHWFDNKNNIFVLCLFLLQHIYVCDCMCVRDKNTHIVYKQPPHLIEARHQVLHSVTPLSTLGRHGGHRQRGLEVRVAFGLTLGAAHVSSEETEVVQGKDLHTDTGTHGWITITASLEINSSHNICLPGTQSLV